MLRALVAVLLVANLAFWAWSAGMLESLGLAPVRERDPTRIAQQLHPQAVRVLPPAAAAAALQRANAAGAGAPQCLEAGPFEADVLETVERTLAGLGLPEGSWVRMRAPAALAVSVSGLRVEAATPAQAEQLRALSGAAPATVFVPCAGAAPAR